MTATSGPFVGRSLLLQQVLDRVTSGRHVVLQGPAGVGKTRLVAELCRRPPLARRRIDRLLGGAGGAAFHLSTLAPLGLPDDAPDNLVALQSWYLRRWQRRRSHDSPALVWLDDAQHVDPLSATILRQAVLNGLVQLLATHRTPEPLGEAMTALWTEGVTEHVPVPPLERADADQLARHAAGAELDADTLNSVHRLAAGNPLFTRELAAASASGEVTAVLHDVEVLLGAPVLRLPPSPRRTLEMVAVAEPAPQRLLTTRVEDLRELRRLGLVVQHDNDTVRVDHPLRRAWILQDLGSARADVLLQLLDLAAEQNLDEDLEPVTVVDWELQAGRQPAPDRLERATRVAVARRDAQTALRFADNLPGSLGQLLRGQALIISGDLHRGLDVLRELVSSGPVPVRVEAAFWASRYLGVMLGDYPRAEALLDEVDGHDVDPRRQRLLLAGRLWLFVFGPITDLSVLDRAAHVLETAPGDETTAEIAVAASGLWCQVRSVDTARELFEQAAGGVRQATVGELARCRARTVEGWWHVARGDTRSGVRVVRGAFERAVELGDLESAFLAAGVGGLLSALAGRIRDALAMTAVLQAPPDSEDWFQLRRLADAVHLGNLCLAGRSGEVGDVPDPASEDALHGRPDVYPVLLARARHLREETSGGTPDDAALHTALNRLSRHRKHLWVALIGLETTSLATRPVVHELLSASGRAVGGPGIIAVAGHVARARLERDSEALFRAGCDLEWAELTGPALRVMADVARLAPPTLDEGRAARAALMRLRRQWDGDHLHWLDDVEDLPSVRQSDVAWRIVHGESPRAVADDLCLSRRTVENHLHRTYRSLDLSSREELADVLRGPDRPAGWVPGASAAAG